MTTVPIVTEVTTAELTTLVSESGLNPGLQYKTTETGVVVVATSTNTYVKIDARPYKVYTALLTQTGENAPVATVLENTIGDIVWSRTDVGVYFATLSGAFPINKTFIIPTYIDGEDNTTRYGIISVSLDYISISMFHLGSGDQVDGLKYDNLFFEIRVYN